METLRKDINEIEVVTEGSEEEMLWGVGGSKNN